MKGLFSTKNVVLIAMFSSLAAVLMLIEVPLPFIAPSFYELDLSEVPIMIGTFIMGPVSGVIMEAVKILLKLLIKGTSTAYVGDFANFCIGCCYVVPAGIIYRKLKSRRNAIKGLVLGTISMATVGFLLNFFVMIPFYSEFFGMPIDLILDMGRKIYPVISNKFNFVLLCVVPFNILKGIIIGTITLLVYKRISTLIKSIGSK